MLWLVCFLLFGQPAALSPADRAALATLRRSVDQREGGKISASQFERLAPRSKIPTWQRLQQQIPSPRSGSADLAFVLAYYGVDYPQNLRRLLLSYRRLNRANAHSSERTLAHDEAVVENLPADLSLLYRKHLDARSLGALLDMRLDGASSEEQMGALQELWPGHAVEMLRVADGSPARLGNLAEMLGGEDETAGQSKDTLAEVQKYARHRDPRVRRAAERVAFLLKATYSRL
jgi:hypothetical protein